VLDANEQPVPADALTAAIFHEKHWKVARDRVGAVEISTVFLGSDCRLGRPTPWEPAVIGQYKPTLWETALLTAGDTRPVERYTSAQAAREGHARIVAELRKEGV
jgi:hypothetical protein